ncbi:MAG: formate/nitrite transporter family protein [Chlorobiota bacterium]
MYLHPEEAVSTMLAAAEKKAALPIPTLVVRGFLAGALLGYATSLSFVPQLQGLPPFLGAVLFPMGFVLLVLLGLELVTGNFALLPLARFAGRISTGQVLRNWAWVYIGNLLGGGAYALLFTAVTLDGRVSELLLALAHRKTLAYQALGAEGWGAAFLKGILCNWMVTLGTAIAFFSTTTTGKVLTMWLPIMAFFALGYEHSVVNMFVLPAALLTGKASITVGQWWLWNQLPVTLGNLVGAVFLTSFPLLTYVRSVAQPER